MAAQVTWAMSLHGASAIQISLATISISFASGHDLAGNQLDFVRLDVSNVHIWTIDPTTQWQGWTADVTYEFWGTPSPEPATILPATLAVLLCCRRRTLALV